MNERTQPAMTARDFILQRIQTALNTVAETTAPESEVPRAYRQVDDTPRDEIVVRFIERAGEYKATVYETTPADLPRAIAAALARRGVQRLVVPADLPEAWLPADITLLSDAGFLPERVSSRLPLERSLLSSGGGTRDCERRRDGTPLTNEALDASDGVLTACALAIAQTGTIVLDGGPGQGRRALSLIPDYHLCIVRADQIVGIVPEAIAALAPHAGQPLTFISGPSATSDIELNRVEGVHGPRTLEILVVQEPGESGK